MTKCPYSVNIIINKDKTYTCEYSVKDVGTFCTINFECIDEDAGEYYSEYDNVSVVMFVSKRGYIQKSKTYIQYTVRSNKVTYGYTD